MSEPPRRSLLSRRAMAGTAVGFWLFVAVLSEAQVLWVAQTPGERAAARGAVSWQTAYFIAWIPFTIAIWQITRRWLPDHPGGWLRILAAHIPVFAAVTLTHSLVAAVIGRRPGHPRQ